VRQRQYNQNCPVAIGLDVLGERWTLLILRELLGGARRYSDLRAELPGIATNLLAQRLRELEDTGVVERAELPPPASRTVYQLTDRAWQQIPPIIQSLAIFGHSHLAVPLGTVAVPPLTGFLAGIVVAFDPGRAANLAATYLVCIDDRPFRFAIRDGHLAEARGEPQVTLTASAADLVAWRLSPDPGTRSAAASRIAIEGNQRAVARFCTLFALPNASDVPTGTGEAKGSPASG
jgi:DNA-binding HxlR family transcriptional regulator